MLASPGHPWSPLSKRSRAGPCVALRAGHQLGGSWRPEPSPAGGSCSCSWGPSNSPGCYQAASTSSSTSAGMAVGLARGSPTKMPVFRLSPQEVCSSALVPGDLLTHFLWWPLFLVLAQHFLTTSRRMNGGYLLLGSLVSLLGCDITLG